MLRGRRCPVVVGVAHQLHLVLPVPAHHLERPAADRAFAILIAAAQQRGGRLDAEKALRQHFEEGRVGCGQRHLGSVGIDDLRAPVLADIATGSAGLGLGVGHVVEVGLDRFGVEGRAVGEVHISAQVEGVAQAVRGHFPACGEPGADLALAVHRDQ